MAQKDILIVSGSGDQINFGSVAAHLKRRGYRVTVFEPDSIANGSRRFTARLTDSVFTFSYDGEPFDPGTFGAVWCRRPHFYGPVKDKLRWLTVKDEYGSLVDMLWDFIPEGACLNPPRKMRLAAHKLPQLQKAAELGFTVPDTAVTNSWDAVDSLPYEKVIAKFNHSILLEEEGIAKVMATAVYTKEALPKQVLPYPGIWQVFKEKKKEWRVTVVGDRVFGVAIYTDDDAKDDWRRHQFSSRTTFKAEPFPEAYQEKCLALLKYYGLRYGAFDFIETPDGEMIYLEVNPNGQFMWLEQDLKLPISEAIAEELIAIATSRSNSLIAP
jgi:hypothetical protein